MAKMINLEQSLEFQVRRNRELFSKILGTENEQETLVQLKKSLKILHENTPCPSIACYQSGKPGYHLLEKMKILKSGYGDSFAPTKFGLTMINAYRKEINMQTIEEERAALHSRIASGANHLS